MDIGEITRRLDYLNLDRACHKSRQTKRQNDLARGMCELATLHNNSTTDMKPDNYTCGSMLLS